MQQFYSKEQVQADIDYFVNNVDEIIRKRLGYGQSQQIVAVISDAEYYSIEIPQEVYTLANRL